MHRHTHIHSLTLINHAALPASHPENIPSSRSFLSRAPTGSLGERPPITPTHKLSFPQSLPPLVLKKPHSWFSRPHPGLSVGEGPQEGLPWFFSQVSQVSDKHSYGGFPDSSDGKESTGHAGRRWFNPWVGKIPWRRAQKPTPVFLPGESPCTEEPGGLQSIRSQSWTRVMFPYGCKDMTHNRG